MRSIIDYQIVPSVVPSSSLNDGLVLPTRERPAKITVSVTGEKMPSSFLTCGAQTPNLDPSNQAASAAGICHLDLVLSKLYL